MGLASGAQALVAVLRRWAQDRMHCAVCMYALVLQPMLAHCLPRPARAPGWHALLSSVLFAPHPHIITPACWHHTHRCSTHRMSGAHFCSWVCWGGRQAKRVAGHLTNRTSQRPTSMHPSTAHPSPECGILCSLHRWAISHPIGQVSYGIGVTTTCIGRLGQCAIHIRSLGRLGMPGEATCRALGHAHRAWFGDMCWAVAA